MRKTNSSPHGKLSRVSRACFLVLCTTWCITVGFVQLSDATQDTVFTGTWYHQGDANERARRYEAIDRVTEGLNILIRGRARQKLRAETTPPQAITLTDKGNQVTIDMRGRRVTLTTDGKPIRVNSDRGSATIRALRQKGQLVVVAQGENGAQTTVYRLSDDRLRLTLDISISGKKLRQPLRYQATYVRSAKARKQ
ncbi:MAG: hypothetical protein ACFCD0_15245 [Gemmataceae bacterium]